MNMKLRLAVAVVLATAAGLSSFADGAVQNKKIAFAIEAQPMSAALVEFSKQSGVQVAFPIENAQGILAPAVEGELSAHAALTLLLQGTGLRYEFINEDRIVTIRPVAANRTGAVDGSSQSGGLRVAEVDELNDAGDAEQASKNLWNRFLVAQADPGATSIDAAKQEESPGSTRLEEIIVSAQKRKEALQEVPISISVVSGAELDKSRAQGITETLSRIPAVAVSEGIQGGGTQITIRGVSNGAALLSGASTSAYYIDSVPFGFIRNAVNPDPAAYDLERVEVLRGPQGTLYGANALNGVVRILTHDADLDTFELKARTSVSTTDDGGENYRGDMAVNVPIVEDKLAVRAVLGRNDLSGWIDAPNLGDEDINDAQLDNARVRIRAQPTERLSIGVSAWRSENVYGGPPISNDEGTRTASEDETIKTVFTTYGLDAGYDFGAFSLSSASAYIDYANRGDLFSLLITELYSRVFSQEVILSSTDAGAWEWSFGAFYRDAKDEWYQDLYAFFGTPAGVPDANWIDTSKQYALFGEVSRRFFHDQLKWTLGLRTFRDESRTQGFVTDLNVYTATYKATTPRVVLTWMPNPDLSIYSSYAQGYRSGALQPDGVTAFFPDVDPDTLNNYEIGAKGSFLDQRVSLEVAVFYIDWQDVQQTLNIIFGTRPDTGEPIGGNVLVNGASASGFGADLAVTVRPAEGLELGASLSWNDLTMDAAVFSFGNINDPAPTRVFAPGDRLGFSPEYTASGFAEYAFPIGGGFEGRLSGSINYTSSQDSFSGTTRLFGDDMTIARASFSIEGEHWTATLFGENLNNEDGSVVPQFGPDGVRVRPRTVGLQLEFRY